MSTQPGPQQPQPVKPDPDVQVLDLQDPPGRIEATWELSHPAQYLLHPYPFTSPILMSTSNPDEEWVDAAKRVLIFTHQLPDRNRASIRNKKLEHFQFYFWTALDRARRHNKPLDGSVRLWEHHDLQGMLAWWRECCHAPIATRIGESNDGLWRDILVSSPWFDCPIFEDLLWEVEMDDNGQPKMYADGEVMVTLRDPKSAALEEEFFKR